MTHPPPPRPGIPAYDYSEPTEELVRAALTRVFGADRAEREWATACRASGLAVGGAVRGSALERTVRALAAQGAAQATVARSIEIRMRTYDRLATRAGATAGGRA